MEYWWNEPNDEEDAQRICAVLALIDRIARHPDAAARVEALKALVGNMLPWCEAYEMNEAIDEADECLRVA